MKIIDLRSDTVTVPTPEMRQAMATAEVGDDVYGEDPSVNRLEDLAARMLGKEAGLFLTSGTMGNQVAALAHTRRGDEVIAERSAHVFLYEVAALAAVGALQVMPLAGRAGAMDPDEVEAAIRAANVHFPRTGLITVENTHNRAGGTIIPPDNLAAIAALARRHGIPVHLDGARIFNAAVALGRGVAELCAPADTVQVCLSKGLGAPVGSLLAGPRPLMAEARRYRKMLGGGMRQAGILAAAGIVALTTMVDRLADDHANARLLAAGLAELPGIHVDMATVQTNMVYVEVTDRRRDAPALAAALTAAGVRCHATDPRRIRLVCHKDVTTADIRDALDRTESVLRP